MLGLKSRQTKCMSACVSEVKAVIKTVAQGHKEENEAETDNGFSVHPSVFICV